MNEYYGNSAKKYGQPEDKYFTLFPALDRAIPEAKQGQSAIDLGCGNGVLADLLTSKGYSYLGMDLSEDMLEVARHNNPKNNFLQADVTKPITNLTGKFDVVISNMVAPSMKDQDQFDGLFHTAATVMDHKSIFVLTSGHPCFDGYMQKHFFGREDVSTAFRDYFDSGAVYTVTRTLENGSFTFTDHHWTLSNYYQSAHKANLTIEAVDECPLVGNPPESVRAKFHKKGSPSYIALTLRKLE